MAYLGRTPAWGSYEKQNITNEHAEVQAVCNAVWTQDVKDAYAIFKASQEDNI